MRGYTFKSVEVPVEGKVILGLEGAIGAIDERMTEAINAWRRATADEKPTSAVIALAEACEFYANGIDVAHMFTEPERVAIRERAINDLEGERRERVIRLFDRLNDPSFRTRLAASLAIDQVPHNTDEVALLTRLYGLRSKILHGASRTLPRDDELREAIALVNRMIMFRLYRLGRGMTGSPDQ